MQGNNQIVPIEDLLRREMIGRLRRHRPCTAPPSTTVAEAIKMLRGGNSGGCVIITDGVGIEMGANINPTESAIFRPVEGTGKPIGIFTERDYLDRIALLDRNAHAAALKASLDQFMTSGLTTLQSDASVETAIQLMTDGGYRHLPLIDASGDLVGVVSAHDIVHHLAEYFPTEVYNQPPRLHQDQRIHQREGG